ncbi:hypothetical protein TSUD_196990 [Trifolium subterraneum]|uniref:Uncharacterized protein n=1 Tax=Trifolium subterraneum TaxID=3900 RepID=A0A2Z6LG59_TRISU|nr:hypothetical protein TSUD_196990 [Trifolium subterraneum]
MPSISKSNGKLKSTIQVEEEPVQQHQFSNQELAECLFIEDLNKALLPIDYFNKSTPKWQAAKELRAKLPPPRLIERYPSRELFLEYQEIQKKLLEDRQATNTAIWVLEKKVHEYKLMEQVNRNTQNLDLEDLYPLFGPGSVQDPPKQG